ncbi:MAG: serine/threonine protein kinase [Deltaproteobacteria bacterium]|nr:serine/threonine protein kinase [Deltaproteobacteria bacterium]
MLAIDFKTVTPASQRPISLGSEFPDLETFLLARDLERGAEIGKGGTGRVYEAVHRTLKVKSALKVFDPNPLFVDGDPGRRIKARDRMLRESRLLAAVRHPGVVGVRDVALVSGDPVLVLEYVEGQHLQAFVQQVGTLAEERAIGLTLGILDAVDALHQAGVTHRDISPKNVIVTKSERPVLIDLGLGYRAEIEDRTRLTTTGPGTPGYWAPELEDEPLTTSPQVDVFSAAAVTHFMLVGRAPRRAVLEIPEVVSPALGAWLRKCLVSDPSKRFATVKEMAAALREAVAPPVP